jgi:flagellar biosynthesis protein FlhG
MSDQAEQLRLLARTTKPKLLHSPKIVMISSGKGGVGKSNLSLNLALSLQQSGKRVLLIDADIGFANIDVLMGIRANHHLLQVSNQDLSIWDVMTTGPLGLKFIAGGSGFSELANLSSAQVHLLIEQMSQLDGQFDFILVDSGAGIQEYTLKMAAISDDVLLITTPEPTAITDAYALVKVLTRQQQTPKIRLVVNRVSTILDGRSAADKVILVAKRFLNVDIDVLGYVYDDPNLQRAVMKQQPILLHAPESSSSRCIVQLMRNYVTGIANEPKIKEPKSFYQKMKRLFGG